MTDSSYVIACDIGGTTTRVGIASESGETTQIVREPTAQNPAELVGQVRRLGRRLVVDMGWAERKLRSVVAALPASINPTSGEIHRADNLHELNGYDFRGTLEEVMQADVVLENDANAAAFGEYRRGGGSDVGSVALLAVGTGVGLGAIVDGRLVHGATGAAGEICFLPIGADPYSVEATRVGAFALAVAGEAVSRTSDTLRDGHPTTSIPRGATATEIFRAARLGDPLGAAVLELEASLIALALMSVAAVLDPELLLLGGGVGSDPALPGPVGERLRRLIPDPPPLRTARLGQNAGIIGALQMALDARHSSTRT